MAVQAYASETLAAPRGVKVPLEERRIPLPAAHVTILIHGVNDDGKGWSLRFKDALTAGRPPDRRPEVHLFRWTRPDGGVPDLAHARNSVEAIERKVPNYPENEAGYQTG